MPHPLVRQLRFARDEFRRGLVGLTEDEGGRRFEPMNCISWNVGHLAWQEQRYWLQRAQRQLPFPELNEQLANGAPAFQPSLAEMPVGEAVQFERLGYFCADPASGPDGLVFNRTIELRDTWAKMQVGG